MKIYFRRSIFELEENDVLEINLTNLVIIKENYKIETNIYDKNEKLYIEDKGIQQRIKISVLFQYSKRLDYSNLIDLLYELQDKQDINVDGNIIKNVFFIGYNINKRKLIFLTEDNLFEISNCNYSFLYYTYDEIIHESEWTGLGKEVK